MSVMTTSDSSQQSNPIMPDPALRYVIDTVTTTKPRTLVKVYGIQAVPMEYQITHSAHGIMDTANFKIAMPGGIDWSQALKDPKVKGDSIVCEIYAGFPPDATNVQITQLNQRFIGVLDKNGLSCKASVWSFECSSLVTLLLTEKQTTLVQGQTTKQYLDAVAAQAGMQVSAIPGPNGYAQMSRVFAQAFVVGIRTVHPWAILQACAQTDDVDLWVRGSTIYYWSPYASVQNRPRYQLIYGTKSLIDCELEQSPQDPANVQVVTYTNKTKVSSSYKIDVNGDASDPKSRISVVIPRWGMAGSETVSTSSTGTTVGNSQSSGGAYKAGSSSIPKELGRESLVYHIPNLTPAQAQAEANNIKEQLARTERKATFTVPVTPDLIAKLNVETLFELYGAPATEYNTGATIPLPATGPNQPEGTFTNYAYWPRQIEETFDHEGLVARLTCLNHGTPQGAEDASSAGAL